MSGLGLPNPQALPIEIMKIHYPHCTSGIATFKTRDTAIAVGRAHPVLIEPLYEKNLPPIRPFNKLFNGVSHKQSFWKYSTWNRAP